MSEVLFTTVHGSRLYGFSHSNSDYDSYIVTDSVSNKARNKIVGDNDTVTVGLSRFMELAYSGSHQSLEALFSPYKEYTEEGLKYETYIENTRIFGGEVFEKYMRTIKKFSFGDYKRRRHAVRLAINLTELRRDGRFSPNLTSANIVFCNKVAELENETLYEYISQISQISFHPADFKVV